MKDKWETLVAPDRPVVSRDAWNDNYGSLETRSYKSRMRGHVKACVATFAVLLPFLTTSFGSSEKIKELQPDHSSY